MAVFEFKAIDKAGRQKKGVMEGDSARQVRQMLRDKGLIPTELVHAKAAEEKQKKGGFGFKRGISAPELALITRQMATLVASSMPLEESLKAVAEQCEKDRLSTMMMAVRGKVLEGHTLAESLQEFPHVFDDLFCATVAAGEKSGHLDTVLNRLADHTEQRQATNSKLIQALVYPIVLTVIATGVITLLLAVVVPKIVAQFEHMGQGLPTTTKILIGASDFVLNYGLYIFVAAILLMMGVQRLLAQPKWKLKYHGWQLFMPVLGKVIRGMNTARYARTLAILTASSVPLLEAMRIASDVLTNLRIKNATHDATGHVREGTSLRAALTDTKLFPPMMLHMIASGERSGELEQMLTRAADNQEREFDSLMTVAMGLLGPLVLVAMAGVVLFIVVAILQPIINLNNLVG
ncbi:MULTISPECIES: type II secretion system inner membrane protein GspF [Corallincola]|uniref:General secretion pathway protein F n=3 Tax=Corallincola TaxID=1775176 RepID=A0A368NL24_9GAMM|nr:MULTISPECIES: type II secretion system inner membrane protein GspF [Corallincola]RCU51138.1 type II secretion system protein GspF [Corallincola holothuriorum]TAA46070.1 type II secretion system protein GspF [Corallincola spongiicola]TCI01434.1 type II secretion system protein GspF [Corallincola luteus]